MRVAKLSILMLVVAMILTVAIPCMAQGPMGMMSQIGDELNLTDEQGEQIQAAMGEMFRNAMSEMQGLDGDERREKMMEMRTTMEETIAGVLTEEQNVRGREIRIQMEGVRSLARDDIQEELGLSEEQKTQLEAVGDKVREQFEELGQAARSGDAEAREGLREKFEELGQRVERAAMHILTDEQEAKFEEMKGEPFEFDRSAWGQRRPGSQGGQGGSFDYQRPDREAPSTEGRNTGAFPRGGGEEEVEEEE
jgi:Spy/CpxP family protein refolding chaperone